MRYRGARVIAIDDQEHHLRGIVRALHRTGVGVLPFHYTGASSLKRCLPGVRIVFSDISVLASGGQPHQQHAAVANIMDTLLGSENGPWMLVAWTSSPDQVDDLHAALVAMLGPGGKAPLASIALGKGEFMSSNGAFRIGAIADAIEERVSADPVVGAIFDLEIRAAEAARDITRTIVQLGAGGGHPSVADVLKALSKAADASAPASPELVFQTIAPAFQDRMAKRKVSNSERAVWEGAFSASTDHKLETPQSSILNTSLHLDPVAGRSDRGALIRVPPDLHPALRRATGMDLSEMLFTHFLDRKKTLSSARAVQKAKAQAGAPSRTDDELMEDVLEKVGWWLVEAVPSCDVSNDKRGLRRALVGVGVPIELGDQKRTGEYVFKLPVLRIDGEDIDIYTSAKVTISPFSGRLSKIKPSGRLRDTVLDSIILSIAGSQSRLGWLSF